MRCDYNAGDISFRKNRIHGSLKSKLGEGFRGGRSLGARRARFGFEQNSGAIASRRGKIAGAAAKPLISLETAKENVWNSLEKAWKSLEFSWKSLDFPWKGVEKFGPVRGGRSESERRLDRIAGDAVPAKAGIQTCRRCALSPLDSRFRGNDMSDAAMT